MNAYATIREIADRIWRKAQDATADYIAEHYPKSRTVWETHDSGKYRRIIRSPRGTERTITYDYRTEIIVTN
jgi:hypothetical protein